jgi:hypothetical protein
MIPVPLTPFATLSRLAVSLFAICCLAHAAFAHNAPGSSLLLDFHSDRLGAELRLPLSELEIAFREPLEVMLAIDAPGRRGDTTLTPIKLEVGELVTRATPLPFVNPKLTHMSSSRMAGVNVFLNVISRFCAVELTCAIEAPNILFAVPVDWYEAVKEAGGES